MAGDFNGSPRGSVYKYIKSQNFRSAIEEIQAVPSEELSAVSHITRMKKKVHVDHIFYLNPSEQTEARLPPVPDWTNLVFRELINHIVKKYGEVITMGEVFRKFDQDNSTFVTPEEFEQALKSLGFVGEGQAALTAEEIRILIDSADRNGDGMIDYKEFYDRFWLALNDDDSGVKRRIERKKSFFARSAWLSNKEGVTLGQSNLLQMDPATSLASLIVKKDIPNVRPMGDLSVKAFRLLPADLEQGHWPGDYSLSDHGMVECTLTGIALGPEPPSMVIDPNPVAQKQSMEP